MSFDNIHDKLKESQIKLTTRINSTVCNLFNNKNIIALTQITNTEIFAFITFLAFQFIKSERFVYRLFKSGLLFLKKSNFDWVNYCKIINSWNAKFSGHF